MVGSLESSDSGHVDVHMTIPRNSYGDHQFMCPECSGHFYGTSWQDTHYWVTCSSAACHFKVLMKDAWKHTSFRTADDCTVEWGWGT